MATWRAVAAVLQWAEAIWPEAVVVVRMLTLSNKHMLQKSFCFHDLYAAAAAAAVVVAVVVVAVGVRM